MESSMKAPQKSKNRTTLWSSNTISRGITWCKSRYNKDTCTSMFAFTFFKSSVIVRAVAFSYVFIKLLCQ
jgi:hypothetical protein